MNTLTFIIVVSVAFMALGVVAMLWPDPKPQPPAAPLDINAAVEYAQNLYDFANRTRGGAFSTRRGIPPRSIRITAADPINLTELLGRGGSRKALIGEVNEELRGRL
jgi:hypothetical protein